MVTSCRFTGYFIIEDFLQKFHVNPMADGAVFFLFPIDSNGNTMDILWDVIMQ
jgi:hypothetical protein